MRNTIDGYSTWLLRMAINISWKDNVTNIQLYRGMPNISDVIRYIRLEGHYIRHTDELVHNLIVWKSKNGIRNRGRQPKTCI